MKKANWWLDKWWLVMTDGVSDLCIQDPGFDVDLHIITDLRSMTNVWMGDLTVAEALKSGVIELHGSQSLIKKIDSWLTLSRHAHHERPPEPMNLERFFATPLMESGE